MFFISNLVERSLRGYFVYAQTTVDFIQLEIKKQTSNTIITQAYHSRCSSSKVSSKASIASDFETLLRIKQAENENDAMPYFSTKNPINKLAMDNRRLLIAAVFHFVHPEEKDS